MEQAIFGGIAGLVSRTATAPIDLFRIQRQNSFMPNSTLRQTVKTEGIRYLWKGNGINCFRIGPQMAVQTFMYTQLQKHTNHFTAGFISGMVAQFTVYPLETLRTHFSLQNKSSIYSTGMKSAFRKILENPLQYYRGGGISLFGSGTFTAVNFGTKQKLHDLFPSSEGKKWTHGVTGFLSSICAISISYPTDLLRRRYQLMNFSKDAPKYSSVWNAITTIITKEGIRGLYRGYLPSVIKIAPTNAIFFYSLTFLRSHFEKKNSNR